MPASLTSQNRGVDLDLVFLGTGGSMPTGRRSPPARLLRRGGDRLLVDCAEGTQRQLMRSNVGLVELTEVFLTHYHADHYLGLPGMLKTFALRGRELPLTVYGPRGLTDLFAALKRIFGRLTYPYELVELQAGDVLDRGDYRIVPFNVVHGVPALGYALVEEERAGRFDVAAADALGVTAGPERGRLQAGETIALGDGSVVAPEQVLGPPRPGRKVLITGDTAPSLGYLELAQDAELLVHEATFLEEERERARETSHSTAREAAQVAAAAGVKLLALTHLSARYFGPEAAREAREVFPDTVVPRDFDVVDIPFAERGAPSLVKGGAVLTAPESVSSGQP
jgi:ribonuclease Z